MENISKNKRRGRPKLHNVAETFLLSIDVDMEKRTKRTLNNEVHFSKGFELFSDSDEFSYLIDSKNQIIKRKTIVSNLGRVADKYGEQTALDMAKIICDKKLNTSQAINLIKTYRSNYEDNLSKDKVGATYKKIMTVIKDAVLSDDEFDRLMEKLQSGIIRY